MSPEDIAGFYDFVPVDGTLPIDRFAQANLWKEILLGMAQMPMIAQQYDIGRIFEWMSQLAGLNSIRQMRIQPTPDSMIRELAAGGEIEPMMANPEMTGIGNNRMGLNQMEGVPVA